MTVPGNLANHGYLPSIVFKELAAGRQCEITGSMLVHIKNIEDYKSKKDKLIGKFGEVISRTHGNVALIATRSPPPWAEKKIDEVIWDCEEMIRWDVPINDR
jgi:hypothetical protein